MQPTRPPIDRDVLAELRRGDERALERLFRDRYADLTAEAQSQLETDGTAAPRVVEDAFLSAWKARAHFETPQSLEAFLHEHVHMNAVRERSRRASLHRFESQGRVPNPTHPPMADVDDAWRHVSAILHAPTPTATSAAQAAKEMRHEAAEHVKAIASPTPWIWPAVIAAVLGAAMFAGLRWVDLTSKETAVTKALAASDVRTFPARSGQRAAVTLSDGSQVTVGSESRLVVPAGFSSSSLRAVQLDGTAAFAATRSSPPLEVRAGPASITSDGGEFDVSAFGNSEALVRVRNGRATVRAGDASRDLGPNEAVVARADGALATPTAATLDQSLGWTGDRFVATNQPLQALLPLMSRWYDVRLQPRDPALLSRRATVNASLASSRDAIAQLERTAGVRMEWEGRQMMLTDAGTPPAPAAPTSR